MQFVCSAGVTKQVRMFETMCGWKLVGDVGGELLKGEKMGKKKTQKIGARVG